MTRRLSPIAGLMLAGLSMTGCSKELEVNVLSEPAASENVSAQTYAWVTDEPVLIMAGEPNEVRTERNEKRFRNAFNLAMQGKGYTLAAGEGADLVIAFSVGTDVRYRLDGGSGQFGVVGSGPSESSTKGTAHVYLYDGSSGDLLWHASTWKWVAKGGEKDELLNEGAKMLLADFPNATAGAAEPTQEAPAEEAPAEEAAADEAAADAPAEEAAAEAPAAE